MIEKLFNSLLGSAIMLGAFIAYQEIREDRRVPIESWISAEAVNSPVMAGNALLVHIERVKVRDDCTVASSRQAIDANGRPWSIPSAVTIGGGSEQDAIDWSYQIPRDLPSGQYMLRVFLTYTCPEFVWTTQQPDTPFQVM